MSNEREEKRAYNSRIIDVVHGSFTPLVFTPYGGGGREAERCITELSRLIAVKRDINTSIVMNWTGITMSFYIN